MNGFDQPVSTPSPRRVVLHIDRVVLRGFAPDERGAMLGALHSELMRMLSDSATRERMLQCPQIDAIRLPRLPFVAGPAGGRSLGRRIAASIIMPPPKGAKP